MQLARATGNLFFILPYVVSQYSNTSNTYGMLHCICTLRYNIMTECWNANPEERPSFARIALTLGEMLSVKKVSIPAQDDNSFLFVCLFFFLFFFFQTL